MTPGYAKATPSPPHYDPMIANVISYAETRAKALARLDDALGDTRIAGTVTNTAFLRALCQHSGFATGQMDTGLIGRDIDSLIRIPDPSDDVIALAAKAALGLPILAGYQEPDTIFGESGMFDMLPGFSLWQSGRQCQEVIFSGSHHRAWFSQLEGTWHYQIEHPESGNSDWRMDPESRDPRSAPDVAVFEDKVAVFAPEYTYEFSVPDKWDSATSATAGGDVILAPMPGLVKEVRVEVGQEVKSGDPLLILEAMKMEHTLTAPRNGTIESVNVEKREPGFRRDDHGFTGNGR